MKKLIAAFLLAIYLFNLSGQLVVHQYVAYLTDKFFTEQTGRGYYNTGELTEVKLPVNMPGISDWKEYENIRGQIQFDNVSYNYVKMKITSHCLYLMCAPDYKTTQLITKNIIDAKGVKHSNVPKKDHAPYGRSTTIGTIHLDFTQFAFSSFSKILPVTPVHASQRPAGSFLSIPEQPPRRSC